MNFEINKSIAVGQTSSEETGSISSIKTSRSLVENNEEILFLRRKRENLEHAEPGFVTAKSSTVLNDVSCLSSVQRRNSTSVITLSENKKDHEKLETKSDHEQVNLVQKIKKEEKNNVELDKIESEPKEKEECQVVQTFESCLELVDVKDSNLAQILPQNDSAENSSVKEAKKPLEGLKVLQELLDNISDDQENPFEIQQQISKILNIQESDQSETEKQSEIPEESQENQSEIPESLPNVEENQSEISEDQIRIAKLETKSDEVHLLMPEIPSVNSEIEENHPEIQENQSHIQESGIQKNFSSSEVDDFPEIEENSQEIEENQPEVTETGEHPPEIVENQSEIEQKSPENEPNPFEIEENLPNIEEKPPEIEETSPR